MTVRGGSLADDPGSSLRPGGYDDAVRTADPLVILLYRLGRDHMPLGALQAEIERACLAAGAIATFSNDFLAAYAVESAARLRGATAVDALAAGHAAIKRPA